MTDRADRAGQVRAPAPPVIRPGRPADALGHPLRVALLDLLDERGTLTSTEAARELGESSGACSFHLRQLERYGQIEEVPGSGGRARPWRLTPVRAGSATASGAELPGAERQGAEQRGTPAGPALAEQPGRPRPQQSDDEFGALARELENEGYRRWLAGRETAPPGWHDAAFSAVVQLTPDELDEVAAAIQAVIAARAGAGSQAGAGDRQEPAGPVSGEAGPALPVGVVVRMFPLLPASSDS